MNKVATLQILVPWMLLHRDHKMFDILQQRLKSVFDSVEGMNTLEQLSERLIARIPFSSDFTSRQENAFRNTRDKKRSNKADLQQRSSDENLATIKKLLLKHCADSLKTLKGGQLLQYYVEITNLVETTSTTAGM